MQKAAILNLLKCGAIAQPQLQTRQTKQISHHVFSPSCKPINKIK